MLVYCAAALLAYLLVKGVLILKNRISNRKDDITYFPDDSAYARTGIINDQANSHSDVAHMAYGHRKMGHNGCEVIAVYNARVMKGMEASMARLATQFQLSGAMIGWGYWGSNPRMIGAVLRRNHMDYAKIHSAKEMERPGIYIISYWTGRRWRSSLHTIAVKRDRFGYTAYNAGSLMHKPPESYAGDTFICGYYLGE